MSVLCGGDARRARRCGLRQRSLRRAALPSPLAALFARCCDADSVARGESGWVHPEFDQHRCLPSGGHCRRALVVDERDERLPTVVDGALALRDADGLLRVSFAEQFRCSRQCPSNASLDDAAVCIDMNLNGTSTRADEGELAPSAIWALFGVQDRSYEIFRGPRASGGRAKHEIAAHAWSVQTCWNLRGAEQGRQSFVDFVLRHRRAHVDSHLQTGRTTGPTTPECCATRGL